MQCIFLFRQSLFNNITRGQHYADTLYIKYTSYATCSDFDDDSVFCLISKLTTQLNSVLYEFFNQYIVDLSVRSHSY